ncbi:MAG: ABC transporter permease subunit [Arthrobacter sp.]|jgi:arabinogalactan oligomer/maltooligosaccharide transport system permease protein|nr:ABC transporter permease subunit [Arthrobacter sp.]
MTQTAEPGQAPSGTPAPTARPERRRRGDRVGPSLGPFILKLVLVGLFDALVLLLLMLLLGKREWTIFGVVLVAAAAINVIYLKKGALPAKYLTPGVVFLLIFQIFTLVYTCYVAFTNYSSGHVLSKPEAVQALLSQNQTRVPDSPAYPLTVVSKGSELGFLVVDPVTGQAQLGTESRPLTDVQAEITDGKAVSTDGWQSLTFAEILAKQNEIFSLVVPRSDDAADGTLRTQDGRTGYQFVSGLSYDADAGTLTDTAQGTVYTDGGKGAFVSSSGETLMPGWSVNVGTENFTRAFTEESIRGPLLKVTLWTFAFALLSVATTFGLGMFLAVVFNKKGMRGRKIYQAIMILPYAFPAFLAAMVWAGMYSKSYGFFNQVLLGGASIPWLEDPTLAKIAVLMLNLWLGFPYMFLVCLGALQSIPDELEEAAKTDGASAWQAFRLIKFPLLLVSVAPLLIASFAFNFNNFNVIYMLTGGGPRDMDAAIPVGETDILISLVYKVAFTGQERDYGLASAFSIIIFVIVAVISIVSFRRTKALEEVN